MWRNDLWESSFRRKSSYVAADVFALDAADCVEER
jgi:hypothetical protein